LAEQLRRRRPATIPTMASLHRRESDLRRNAETFWERANVMRSGKTTKAAGPGRPFPAAEYLRGDAKVATYIEGMLEDGDPRVVPQDRTFARDVESDALQAR